MAPGQLSHHWASHNLSVSYAPFLVSHLPTHIYPTRCFTSSVFLRVPGHLPSPNITGPREINIFWRNSRLKCLLLQEFSLILQILSGFSFSWLREYSGHISHCTNLMVYMSSFLTTVWAPWEPSQCINSSLYPWHSCSLKEKISD